MRCLRIELRQLEVLCALGARAMVPASTRTRPGERHGAHRVQHISSQARYTQVKQRVLLATCLSVACDGIRHGVHVTSQLIPQVGNGLVLHQATMLAGSHTRVAVQVHVRHRGQRLIPPRRKVGQR